PLTWPENTDSSADSMYTAVMENQLSSSATYLNQVRYEMKGKYHLTRLAQSGSSVVRPINLDKTVI
ncbi:MAG: hypothetical protein CYPHOPRED_003613, partial [Cyphobasidiales sp. Tagirdzhanova-0007]